MRWTRFKQQMETTTPLIRKPRRPRGSGLSGKKNLGAPDEKDKLARKRKCVSDDDDNDNDERSDCGETKRKKEEPDENKVKLEPEPVVKDERSHGEEITMKKEEQGSETKLKFEPEPETKVEPYYLSDDVIEVGRVVKYEPEEEGGTIVVKYGGP